MGSAVSAKAADEREAKKQEIRKEKRAKRQRRRFKKQQSQKYDGLKYDETGALFHVNEKGEKTYIDDYGHEYYLDESEHPYYLDEKGKIFYLDENREPFYLEEDGTKYFLDTSGAKYYFDENGEPYLVATGTEDDNNYDNADDEDKVISDTQPDINDSEDDIILDEEELKLRSPVTPIGSGTIYKQKNRSFSLSRRNYRNYSRESDRYSSKTNKSDCKQSVDIIDHRNKDSPSHIYDDNLTFDGTLSSFSTLSFMRSEYEMVLPKTPDYVKDTSKESETQVTAQIEAEKKVLKKLLQKEEEKQILPPSKSFRKVGGFDVKIMSDTKDCNIVDLAFLSTGNVILADISNYKLKQFNENLEYVNSLEVEEKPYGVCAGTDDIIHATFQSRMYDCIKVLKVMSSEIKVHKTIRITSGSPYGIARSHKGLAVMMSTKQGWQIHLMTLQGHISREVNLNNEDIKPLMSPHYIEVTKNLQIIVSDRGNNSVYSFDTNGEVLSEYKQLREPLGICSDKKGSIFAVSPGVVHQISDSGERIKALMRRETIGFSPFSVGYDPEDSLLVLAGKSNNVMAFEMTN